MSGLTLAQEVQMHLEDEEATDAQKLGRIADVVGEALMVEGSITGQPDLVSVRSPRGDRLTDEDRANFETFLRAAENEDVVLLHARRKVTGQAHALLCLKSTVPGTDETALIPFARLLDEDATETYENPVED